MRIMITNTLRTLFLVLFITKALSQECIVTNEVMDTAVEITESSDIVLSMYDYIEYEDCIQECCNEENCSLVMYMEESIECILIDCSVGECVTVSTEGSTVIYVSHTNDPTTTPSTPHLTTINATAYTHSSLLPTESSDYQTNSTEHLIENSTATTNHTDISSNNREDMWKSSEISETHGDTPTNEIGISTENNVNSTNNYVNSTETLKTGAGLTSVQSTVTSSTYAIGNLTNKNTLHSGLTLAQNTTPTSVGDYSTSASESASSSTYTGRTSLSSLSSLSTLISTLLSKTSTKAALVTSANTASMNNSTSAGSFSTSSSFILSTLATNLPINENVTFLQNHSLSITHNGTNDNGTKVSTKILDENVTIASTTPNILSVTVNNTHYDSESMASSTVLISESTSSVTPGSTSKQSTVSEVPSSHSSSSWWLYNMTSVSSTLPLLKTSLSSLVSTVSSLPTTASIEYSSSGNSRAPTSSSALSSSSSTSMSSRTSAWSESTVSSSESSYITSTSSDTNKTAHEKISSSGSDSDQMSGTLIAVLCVGIVFTFAVGLLFGQRVYDAWQRRHYNKLDYLINGMYG